MSDTITFTIDGTQVKGQPGQTIMEAADEAGIYIPRLCSLKGLTPHGSCRVCTVMANGRSQTACTQPIAEGMIVENDTERINAMRRQIVDMLFVEGNHFCMYCEKSGDCELQALAYRLGIPVPQFPYQFPQREMDTSHPDVFIDRQLCILCGRCVNTSRERDGKNVFEFVGRGPDKQLTVNHRDGLGATDLAADDEVVDACPVGALLRKRTGYATPMGRRRYDHEPIGSDIESKGCADK